MKKNWLVAGALGLIAAIVYFASLASYNYPGESAQLMVYWQGLDFSAAPQYPLMAVFARWLGGGNVIAPICGMISVALLSALVAIFVGWRIRREDLQPAKASLSAIAGVTAGLVFMLSPAVRSAATHLEPRLFDFAWALFSFALILPFTALKRRGLWLYPILLAIVVTLGYCDSALFLTLLPLYIVLVTVLAVKKGLKPYLPLFLFALTAFVTFLVAVNGFDLEVAEFLKASAQQLRGYRSTPGWLFVALFATMPFLIALVSSNKAFNEPPGIVQWLFHAALAFVVILAFATPLAPSSLMETYGILPVASSGYVAVVAGYLIAYWWSQRKQVVAKIVGSVLGFVLAFVCAWNLVVFDGEKGAFADKVAARILQDLGDRQWIVADGQLDNHLLLLAAREHRPLHVISLARDLDEQYLDRLSRVIADEKVGGSRNGELRTALVLGVLPFVQEWFAIDPTVSREVVIFGAPDLWRAGNIEPVPELLFFGADPARVPDWSAWKELDTILAAPPGWGSYRLHESTNPTDRMRYRLRRHLGMVANNRGVWLQDHKRDDEAFKMYELVLNEIDGDNICTLFNELSMVGAGHAGASARRRDLDRKITAFKADAKRRYILWRLGTVYGYIRNPFMVVKEGEVWAKSGRPGAALARIRRAIDFVPSDKRSTLQNLMAVLYANESRLSKSRELYVEVLKKNPKDHDALIGMMRLEFSSGNVAKALEYLDRAAGVSGNAKRAKSEKALSAMLRNDFKTARTLLKEVLDQDTKDMQIWSMLASTVIQQLEQEKDPTVKAALTKELESEIIPQMEKHANGQFDYYLQTTKGFLLLKQDGDRRREARDAFLTAYKARPDVGVAHDLVLGLDISLADIEAAERHAKDVLVRNRNAPLANYVMGSLALGKGKLDEAEVFLRKAADAEQPVALALNDLAETLRRKQQLVEAERYARKAVKLAPGLYAAWDTLGAVLMDTNKNLDEAEACIRKACDLSKTKDGREGDVRMLISLIRCQVRRGDMPHAKVTVRKVQARIGELGEFEKREFEEVKKSVR